LWPEIAVMTFTEHPALASRRQAALRSSWRASYSFAKSVSEAGRRERLAK